MNREQVPVSVFDPEWSLSTRDYQVQITGSAITISPDVNEVSTTFNDGDTYYWNLPMKLHGNHILSYGGKLTITQRTEGYGPWIPDQDVVIQGHSKTLFWSRTNYDEDVSFKLILFLNHFFIISYFSDIPHSNN